MYRSLELHNYEMLLRGGTGRVRLICLAGETALGYLFLCRG